MENAIERAFRVWSDVTPLTFERVFEEEGDIVLSFHRGGKLFDLTLPFNLFCLAGSSLLTNIIDFLELRRKIMSHWMEVH